MERQVEASSWCCSVGTVNQTPDGGGKPGGAKACEYHRLPIWQYLAVPENCRLGENLSNDNK